MSYTHYWRMPKTEGSRHFGELAEACRQILGRAGAEGIALAGPLGIEKEPVVTDTRIAFNGSETLGGDFEPFELRPGQGSAFCRTDHRPYDTVVTACLVAALDIIPGFTVESDGTFRDWKPGIHLYLRAVADRRPLETVFLERHVADQVGDDQPYEVWESEVIRALLEALNL